MRAKAIACALALLLAPTVFAAVPERALELRDRGVAQLENESPEAAEKVYRQLIEVVPDDPLGHANLAIALLRQQKMEEASAAIAAALAKAPGRADLLAIQAEIRQWSGDLAGALALLEQAARAAPEDLEVLFAAYQAANTVGGADGERVAGVVMERLAELRPENVVVLLQRGQRAIAAGDRAVATAAYLRIAQLLWQADPMAVRALQAVTDALKQNNLADARVPAIRLENVLKISPMYRESLRELKTGIQGVPVRRFVDEPPPSDFGPPLAVTFAGTRLDPRPTAGRALAAGDFDGDGRPDLARIRGGDAPTLEVRRAQGGFKVSQELPAPGLDRLLVADLDNDGRLDLVAAGAERGAVWRGQGDGTFVPAPDELGLAAAGAAGLAVVDYDIEGDLDLVAVGRTAGVGDLFRNPLDGPLERVGERTLPHLSLVEPRAVAASDLDRDGDLDLAIAHGRGVSWLDNLRQGRFTDRTAAAGLGGADAPALAALVAADFDDDGYPDLVGAGAGLAAWRNRGGSFERWSPAGLATSQKDLSALLAFDADNDGRLDLAAAGSGGAGVLQRTAQGGFTSVAVEGGPASASALAAADLDGDGDLDLAVAGPDGLYRLENRGGNRHHWLAVRLRGIDKGNSKNNFFGVGATVEVHNGDAYQFREADGDVVHLGLGTQDAAQVLRVVWTNGVPQNRLGVAGDRTLVEEQLLKGSCPFLYAWDGDGFAFVTDLLWNAPLGLPVAPGVYAGADPGELVRIDGLVPDDGRLRLRITEELWEAAFFDRVRLWAVDHPADVEVASTLRVVPGAPADGVDRVAGSREVQPMAAAWDGAGRDVTAAVAQRDEVYADGYRPSPYQGVAAAPWTFTFDLGAAPTTPVRLLLDGWIFPADASLNLAVAQRSDLAPLPPRLEVETAAGWQTLVEDFGHPAGKTKTMVVDLPPLPPGAHKLRLVTSLWLHWDRLAWTDAPADDAPRIAAKLEPATAELRFGGFSRLVRQAPNAPHGYDYAHRRPGSPWLPFPGRYTRFGDVRPLLAEVDDFSVVLAAGDEIALDFDVRDLAPPPPGFVRTWFLESHGWDKDADRNTFEARQVEPLPWNAMSGYPANEGETYPDDPAHRDYREQWLTREVP